MRSLPRPAHVPGTAYQEKEVTMAVLNFIIDNILINAAVILGLVALLGLILQRK